MSKQTKIVTFSMCHPVSVTVEVERATDEDDWDIVGIRDVSCDASPRSVGEHMDDDDWKALDYAIAKQKAKRP